MDNVKVTLGHGDIVKPKFEINENGIKIAMDQWFRVKKADAAGPSSITNMLDPTTSLEVVDNVLQTQFEPVQVEVEQIGDESMVMIDMVFSQIENYFTNNGTENGNAIDNVRGFVSVISDIVDKDILYKKTLDKYGKELTDKLFIEVPETTVTDDSKRDIQVEVSASKTAAKEDGVDIKILDNGKLLVTLPNEVVFNHGLDRFITGRSLNDKGQYRIVDHAPFERCAGKYIKQKYPDCWISQFTQMIVNNDMSITIGANCSNIEDKDSFAKTDFRNIWARKKKAISDIIDPKLMSTLTDKAIMNFTLELEGSEELLRKMLAYMEDQKQKLLKARVDKIIDNRDAKDFNVKISISDQMIASTLNIMNAVKKDIRSVEVKLQKSTDTTNTTNTKPNVDKTNIPSSKIDQIIKIVTSSTLDIKQAVLDIVSDGNIVGDHLDSTIDKAVSVKGDAKKASLQKRADAGDFIGKLFETIKNIWNSFGNALNLFIQTLTNNKDQIQKSANEISSALKGV